MRADSMTEHSQVGESAERKESISVDELDLVSAEVSVERQENKQIHRLNIYRWLWVKIQNSGQALCDFTMRRSV